MNKSTNRQIISKARTELDYKPEVKNIKFNSEYIQAQMGSIKVATDRIIKAKDLFHIAIELDYLKEHTDKLVSACNEIFIEFEELNK